MQSDSGLCITGKQANAETLHFIYIKSVNFQESIGLDLRKRFFFNMCNRRFYFNPHIFLCYLTAI